MARPNNRPDEVSYKTADILSIREWYENEDEWENDKCTRIGTCLLVPKEPCNCIERVTQPWHGQPQYAAHRKNMRNWHTRGDEWECTCPGYSKRLKNPIYRSSNPKK